MKWFIGITCGIVFLLLIFGIFFSTYTEPDKENYKIFPLQNIWACMDGCSNMQEMVFDYDYKNITMKDLHNKCTDICFEQYWIELDEYEP